MLLITLISLRISPTVTPTDKTVLIVIMYLPHYPLKTRWVPSFIRYLFSHVFFVFFAVCNFCTEPNAFPPPVVLLSRFLSVARDKKPWMMWGDNNCPHCASAPSQLKTVMGDLPIMVTCEVRWSDCMWRCERLLPRTEAEPTLTRPESSPLTLCFNLPDCQSEVKLDKEDGASRAAQERSPVQWRLALSSVKAASALIASGSCTCWRLPPEMLTQIQSDLLRFG